jgi:hypothetical protein
MNLASATQVFLGSLSATEMWLGSVKIWPRLWVQLGQDINGEAASDGSGVSVSMNSAGDRVAIGAMLNDGSGTSAGHVRVYSYNGASWVQLGQDIDGEAASDQSGWSVSLNSAGDRVAIGANANDGTGANAGHVRVYSYNGTSWVKLGQDIDGEGAGDQSGISVSMNSAGDRVAIGAYLNIGPNVTNGGQAFGHVRVYSYNGTSWVKLGQDIDGEVILDSSGWSVSLNSAGNRVAISSYRNTSEAGHVRVYSYNGTSWVKLGQDIDGEAAGDRSGWSVSLNSAGDRVAIGATLNDGTGASAGHVRVYSYNGASWVQLGQDIDGEAASDQSGVSVSLNSAGDRVAIGANLNDGSGADAGHVRVYSWNGTSWVKLGQDIDGEAAGDWSGTSVSMNSAGDRVAIGARLNDGSGAEAGHVRVYAL